MDHTDLYIDSAWRPGAASERFDVINPATEEVIASVASADIADADAALDAAETAMRDWAKRSPRARSEVLRKAWELMTARLPDFARLITLENGRLAPTPWAKPLMPQNSSAGLPKRQCEPMA